jgi:peptidoglycan/xylan/chitin deacetylase (PgdA/CDA1 family)
MSSTVSGAERGAGGRSRTPRSRLTPPSLVWALLPALVFCLFAFVQPGLVRGDAAGVYVTAASLVERGSFAIDGYIAAVAPTASTSTAPSGAYPQVAYVAGHYFHAVPPGRALLAVPTFVLGNVLAPLLGAEAPAYCLSLLAALLGAFVVTRLARSLAGGAAVRLPRAVLGALLGLGLIGPWVGSLSTPLVLAALTAALAPGIVALWRGAAGTAVTLGIGILLGAAILIDYLVGLLFGLVLLALCLLLVTRRQRRVQSLVLLLGGSVGPVILAVWQTVTVGLPWRLAFRSSVDPSARPLASLARFDTVAALVLAVAVLGLVAIRVRSGGAGDGQPLYRLGVIASVCAALGSGWLGVALHPRSVVLPLSWGRVGPILAVLLLAAGLVAFARLRPRLARSLRPGLLPTGLCLGLLLPTIWVPTARAVTPVLAAENYAAPFAIETNGAARPLWKVERGTGEIDMTGVRLTPGAVVVSPWIDIWPGSAYALQIESDRPVQASFGWEAPAREPLVAQSATIGAGGRETATFAAPPAAGGLRLRLTATGGAVTVRAARLELTDGIRVEPFPDGNRAALAFSFDWESAMGGLIHSRSIGEGEGATVGLRADGGPSVAEAEAKGQRMRDGAQFLAGLFAQYGIQATFYSTGYNLLDGNPTCQKFLDNPTYTNANMANGWGSDWWRTHPWFGDDPCSTEAEAPAWYFASESRALAAAGHEIASHTFGHLYVRGVKTEQLAADLEQWNRAAAALGLPPARSFAFPWTSSNSLDERFWSVFVRAGMTVLTRLYQTQAQPLPHPYELDRIAGQPELLVFPDFYLASRADAESEALARIDTTLAVRGYHSLWNHPNEVLEQGGQVIWSRVVAYAAAQREQGLWVAPVTEIATYGTATREVAVTALPIAGGTRLTVENRADRDLAGLTVRIAGAGMATLPTLTPGAMATTTVR